MSLLGIFLLALGLAADSFAAAIARGGRTYRPRLRHALLAAALFGGAQVVMPLIGWQVGLRFQPLIERIDHWIAFGILGAIGAKMIYEGLRAAEPETLKSPAFTVTGLLLAAVATSIDSLAAGFGFGLLNVSVLLALAVIGAVTFALSFAGVYLGHRVGRHFGQYVEVGAGLLLIAVGAKILFDHMT